MLVSAAIVGGARARGNRDQSTAAPRDSAGTTSVAARQRSGVAFTDAAAYPDGYSRTRP